MLDNDDITSATASEAVEKVPTEENDCHKHKFSLCVLKVCIATAYQ